MADQTQTAFEFELGEPEQRTESMMSYWVYTVNTRTTLEQYPNKTFDCKRRFNDFFLLRQALVEMHTGVIVPPVPEKSSSTLLEKTGLPVDAKAVVDYRSRALRKFLVRVGAHPILSRSKLLQDFLTLSEELYARKRKQEGEKPKRPAGQKKAAGTSPAPTAEAPELTTTGDEWLDTMKYVQSLEDFLSSLKDRIHHVVECRRKHCDTLKTFGRSLAKLGDFETDSRRGTIASKGQKPPRVQTLGLTEAGPRALVQVGNRAEHVSLVYAEVATSERVQVVETIRYYLGMCSAIRVVLDNIKKLRTMVESGESLPAEEGVAREDPKVSLERAQDTFKEELMRFHREKQYDMKQVLKAFLDIQYEASERLKQSWESLVLSE